MDSLVTKRNGEIVPFDFSKVLMAIEKANTETEEMQKEETLDVAYSVEEDAKELGIPAVSVETIQDLVEEELMVGGYV